MLSSTLFNFILFTPSVLLTANALGINYRGSSACSFITIGAVSELVKLIDGISDGTCVTLGE